LSKIEKTLEVCFPNSHIGHHRTKNSGNRIQIYCSKDKNTPRDKIYEDREGIEDQERLIVEAIKANLGITAE